MFSFIILTVASVVMFMLCREIRRDYVAQFS
jgi:hypothetical protein